MVNKIELIFGIGIVVLSLIGFIFVGYQLGDNGRWIRDHGVYSSGISDNEVKSIWCDGKLDVSGDNFAYTLPYREENGKEYCGNIEVKMNCRFSNSGDYCDIQRVEGEND